MKKSNCKYFRAKSPSHGNIVGGVSNPESLMKDNLAQCWCIKTQGPMAPDSSYVSPSACLPGRKCFVERA